MKKTTKGILWIVVPMVSLPIILSLYAISRFIFSTLGDTNATLVMLINVILGLLGILALVGTPIGVIMGIIMLAGREILPGVVYDDRSGKGDASILPEEIKGWNWGAAGLTWIWGAVHQVWFSFLMFIPIVNWIFWIVLGLKGNEWAWRKDKWVNVEEFLSVQKKWRPWGMVFLGLRILLIFGGVMSAIADAG